MVINIFQGEMVVRTLDLIRMIIAKCSPKVINKLSNKNYKWGSYNINIENLNTGL